MNSESSSSKPTLVDDKDQEETKVKGLDPGLPSKSDSDGNAVDPDDEDESEAEAPCETEKDILLSVQKPSHVPTHRATSASQTPPRTTGKLRIHSILQCDSEVMTCQFSTDGTLLAVGLSDGSIKVYSTDSKELLHTLRDRDSIVSSLPVTSLCFTHTGQTHNVLLATYASGCVKCWYVWGGECVWWLKETRTNKKGEGEGEKQRQSFCLSISPSGEQAVTGGSDSVIHLYDLNTQERIQILRASSTRTVMDGHSSRVFALAFHPDKETEFISGGWDNTVQFWDTRQKHAARMLYGPHVCGEALHIDQSANQILSGSWRKHNTLEVWDYGSGKNVATVPTDPHGDTMIYTCQWLGADHIIAAGSRANALKIIDRHSLAVKARLCDLPSAVFSTSVCPAGTWAGLIAATSGDQVFLLSWNQGEKST